MIIPEVYFCNFPIHKTLGPVAARPNVCDAFKEAYEYAEIRCGQPNSKTAAIL